MKKWMLVALVCVTPVLVADKVKNEPSRGPLLRVLVKEDCNQALVEAKGKYRVLSSSEEVLSKGLFGKCFTAHSFSNGLRWGEEYEKCRSITITPARENASVFVDGNQYMGSITIYWQPHQKISVVNEIALEDYLYSVCSLMELPEQKESLACYLILKRTEFFQKINPSKNYDCSAKDPIYLGYGHSSKDQRLLSALEATRFMICAKNIKSTQIDKRQIEELSSQGYNAKEILNTFDPHLTLELTKPCPSKIIR